MTVTELHNYTASDRYIKVPKAIHLPGSCFFCRKSEAKFFIDFQMHQEHPEGPHRDGAMYMCSECLEFAAAVGGMTKSPEALVEYAKETAEDLHKFQKYSAALEKIVNELLDFSVDRPDGLDEHISTLLETAQPRFNREPAGESAVEPVNPGIIESDSSQGFTNFAEPSDDSPTLDFG